MMTKKGLMLRPQFLPNPLQAPHTKLLEQRNAEIDKLNISASQTGAHNFIALCQNQTLQYTLRDIALLEHEVNYANTLKAKGKTPRDNTHAYRLYGNASELLAYIEADVAGQQLPSEWNKILSDAKLSLEGALK